MKMAKFWCEPDQVLLIDLDDISCSTIKSNTLEVMILFKSGKTVTLRGKGHCEHLNKVYNEHFGFDDNPPE